MKESGLLVHHSESMFLEQAQGRDGALMELSGSLRAVKSISSPCLCYISPVFTWVLCGLPAWLIPRHFWLPVSCLP